MRACVCVKGNEWKKRFSFLFVLGSQKHLLVPFLGFALKIANNLHFYLEIDIMRKAVRLMKLRIPAREKKKDVQKVLTQFTQLRFNERRGKKCQLVKKMKRERETRTKQSGISRPQLLIWLRLYRSFAWNLHAFHKFWFVSEETNMKQPLCFCMCVCLCHPYWIHITSVFIKTTAVSFRKLCFEYKHHNLNENKCSESGAPP